MYPERGIVQQMSLLRKNFTKSGFMLLITYCLGSLVKHIPRYFIASPTSSWGISGGKVFLRGSTGKSDRRLPKTLGESTVIVGSLFALSSQVWALREFFFLRGKALLEMWPGQAQLFQVKSSFYNEVIIQSKVWGVWIVPWTAGKGLSPSGSHDQ